MKVSGIVIASDGVKKHTPIDFLDTPLYGGWKFLLKDKILNPNLVLKDNRLLIEPAIESLFDATLVNDVVVVGNPNQQKDLERVVSNHTNGKPYKVISTTGHIGEVVATGAENLCLPGYSFIIMPDLPFVNGHAVDFAIADILQPEHLGADVYIPILSRDFFQQHNDGWVRPFARLKSNRAQDSKGEYKRIDFVIANSTTINPQAIKEYYEMRMISSLRGIANAVKKVPQIGLEVASKYIISQLSIEDLEAMTSRLYKGDVRIIQVFNPIYHRFMKDIDTLADYRAYRTLSASR